MVAKRGLGKGLSALIPETAEREEKENSIEIDIMQIQPNQYQPRKDFDQEKLQELACSIEEHGIIQPIVVTPMEKGYQIIVGERRWRAAHMCGLKTIPAIIKEFSEQEIMEIALIENLQREDLNIIEQAKAYKQLIDEFSLTQDDLAMRLGKSRSVIANTLRLLTLSNEIQELIKEDKLSPGHGRALLSIKDKDVRNILAKKVIEEKLSVRDLEKLTKNLKNKNQKKRKEQQKQKIIKSPIILELEENLQKILGTKVNIINKNKKGKIEIEYYSNEDLERILEIITS
ncbi:ParB/RepB/Spo0J family partition protein [Garciella nitratireducens]|uniref:Chromosome partitioning protein, ParB family n=1 Tax=Garciella nitratireducens DSM 15102 TaxID=1121911 RepID=A0A1T4PE01_9FIRM|nr:ParB/RepB/Spo0J family partition protein [Garciella nitratireducens]RBP36684.1 ParB family chromosome partitioning protein [Garciella nitratireducens]SJZ89567.1 chromosome partitioning protein, ParB family [Garciella nitratireducens DSM 15102]